MYIYIYIYTHTYIFIHTRQNVCPSFSLAILSGPWSFGRQADIAAHPSKKFRHLPPKRALSGSRTLYTCDYRFFRPQLSRHGSGPLVAVSFICGSRRLYSPGVHRPPLQPWPQKAGAAAPQHWVYAVHSGDCALRLDGLFQQTQGRTRNRQMGCWVKFSVSVLLLTIHPWFFWFPDMFLEVVSEKNTTETLQSIGKFQAVGSYHGGQMAEIPRHQIWVQVCTNFAISPLNRILNFCWWNLRMIRQFVF